MPNLATRVLLRSDRHRLLVFLFGRFVSRGKSLHRDVEIVAVGIGRAGLGIWAICRPLRRSTEAGLHQPPRDLLLAFDMEAEMIQARRLAVGLVGQKRERNVS